MASVLPGLEPDLVLIEGGPEANVLVELAAGEAAIADAAKAMSSRSWKKGSNMIHEILWRRSSFSGGGDAGGGNCVEATNLPDGRTAFRDSKNPADAMSFGPAGARSWIAKIKSGQLG